MPATSSLQTDSSWAGGSFQGHAALFPHGRQEEDAVGGWCHLAAMVAQTAGEAQIGTQASSEGSCDRGIFQKWTAHFTQGVFEIMWKSPWVPQTFN